MQNFSGGGNFMWHNAGHVNIMLLCTILTLKVIKNANACSSCTKI